MGAKALMSNSLRIAWKDLMELFRNRLGLMMLILMPLFMMAMVGFIFPSSTSLNNVPVGIVNNDGAAGSQAFLAALNVVNNKTGMMEISNVSNIDALKESIIKGDLQGGIFIPSNFSQCMSTAQQATLTIVTDNSNPQLSATMQGTLSAVFQQMGTSFAVANVMNATNASATNALAIVEPFKIQVEGVVLHLRPLFCMYLCFGRIAWVTERGYQSNNDRWC